MPIICEWFSKKEWNQKRNTYDDAPPVKWPTLAASGHALRMQMFPSPGRSLRYSAKIIWRKRARNCRTWSGRVRWTVLTLASLYPAKIVFRVHFPGQLWTLQNVRYIDQPSWQPHHTPPTTKQHPLQGANSTQPSSKYSSSWEEFCHGSNQPWNQPKKCFTLLHIPACPSTPKHGTWEGLQKTLQSMVAVCCCIS